MARDPNKKNSKVAIHRYHDGRRLWVGVGRVNVVMSRGEGEFLDGIPEGLVDLVKRYSEVQTNSNGEEIFLNFERDRARFSILLTEMTEKELDAFQDVINYVIDTARPVAKAKDEIVEELYNEHGIDAFPRIYRDIPKVHVRQGEEPLYSESVRRRPFGILEVDERIRIEPHARAADRRLAELEQEEQESSDSDSEAGKRKSLGEVVRAWPAPPRLHTSSAKVDAPPNPRRDDGSGEDVPVSPF